ncbi:MAG: hypothetical protein RL497_1325 [Pseudomonadota bacterium]|jgi:Raf kinase inhibitor-like YbhB/YbcL family protein
MKRQGKILTRVSMVAASFIVVSLFGCGSGNSDFRLLSTSFVSGAALPADHSCEAKEFGQGVSPELHWDRAPKGTKSYAIVFKDTSLEAALPNRAFHWAIWDIPASVSNIPKGLPAGEPTGALAGATHLSAGPGGGAAYFGPCPSWETACPVSPARLNDSYSFTVYAFDVEKVELPADDPNIKNRVRELEAYFEAIALDKAVLKTTSDAAPSVAPTFCPVPAAT